MSEVAADRWIELLRQILVCGQMLGEAISHWAGRRGLRQREFFLLWACQHAQPLGIGQNELADVMAVSAAHVSGLVEQLRSRGLLRGWRPPSDRRRQLWRMTPAGEKALKAVLGDLADWAQQVQTQLGSGAGRMLHRQMEQLVTMLRQQPDRVGGHRGAA